MRSARRRKPRCEQKLQLRVEKDASNELTVTANKKCPPASTDARGLALLGLRNAEPFHLPLQRGTLHSETSCSAVGTANDPVSLAQRAENVLPLGIGQRYGLVAWL